MKHSLLKTHEAFSLQCREAERDLCDNGAPFKYLLAHLHDLIYPEQLLALVSFFSSWHFPPQTFQVASRVQKYFIKLTKAGIPVPGRTPNLCMYTKKVFTKSSNCSWIMHVLNMHLFQYSRLFSLSGVYFININQQFSWTVPINI